MNRLRKTGAVLAAWLAVTALVGPFSSAAEGDEAVTKGSAAYSGGYFDDGFLDDDWYFDFYEVQFTRPAAQPTADGGEYEAEQLYEDARASGLFE